MATSTTSSRRFVGSATRTFLPRSGRALVNHARTSRERRRAVPPLPRVTGEWRVAAFVLCLGVTLVALVTLGCKTAGPRSSAITIAAPSVADRANDGETTPPEPAVPIPPESPRSHVLDLDRFLTIDRFLSDTKAARAIGTFDEARNRLAFQMPNVSAFSLDIAEIPINWSRPVVLSVDGVTVELRRRDDPRLHFERNRQGAWIILEPPKNP